MSGIEEAEASTRRRAPRATARALALGLVALALAGTGLRLHQHRAADVRELLERARGLELPSEPAAELASALARESDPGERRLALARALLAAALEAGPAAGERLLLDRLAAVDGLAREALARLPASAEAPRLIGAALALDRLARRDQALLSGAADWERPLELALERAPSNAAAERVLAAAYLEIWPGLDGDRRERATRVLRTAFEEPGFRQRAFDRWLALAGSIDAATALLPDLPDVWARLLRAAADGGDLERAAQLAVREQDALERSLGEQLERAEQLAGRPGGDLAARGEIDRLLELAPPDLRFAPLVGRALASRPAGPAGPSLARAARRWLVWARPLVLLGFEPLPPAALGRLAGAVGAGLPAEEAAWAALAAGDRPRAELLARRSDALWSEAWAPYLVLDARARLAAGERPEARALLEQVHRNARRWPSWRQLARAAGLAPPAPPAREPAGWQPTDWQVEARVPRLAFELAAPTRGLRLGLATPLAQPTLLVAELDGRSRRPIALEAGATEIRLPFPLEPGAHLLRISVRTGSAPALGVTTPE